MPATVPSMITSRDRSRGVEKHEGRTNALLKGKQESGHNVEELRRAWIGRRRSLYIKDQTSEGPWRDAATEDTD